MPAERLYVNAGYLPGDVIGLPAFAADPRRQIGTGFGARAAEPDLWNSVVLGNVRTLSDFGLIAVVSNSPDITRQLIEQHDGTIAVANRPGGGALFTIRLPVKAEGGGA